jgi:hypothetical protein
MNRVLYAVWRTVGYSAAAGLLVLAGVAPCPAARASDGELRIEGELIKSLTVVNEAGDSRTINRPGASVSLPAGQYTIYQIELDGGAHCSYPRESPSFTISPDKPCRLKAGAPLKPGVTFKRSGKILTLDYKLLDAAGRNYRASGRSADPPRFVVYQGEREIGSGTFEYG